MLVVWSKKFFLLRERETEKETEKKTRKNTQKKSILAFAFLWLFFVISWRKITTASEYMELKTDTISNPFAYINTHKIYVFQKVCIPKAKAKRKKSSQVQKAEYLVVFLLFFFFFALYCTAFSFFYNCFCTVLCFFFVYFPFLSLFLSKKKLFRPPN